MGYVFRAHAETIDSPRPLFVHDCDKEHKSKGDPVPKSRAIAGSEPDRLTWLTTRAFLLRSEADTMSFGFLELGFGRVSHESLTAL